MSKPLIQMGDQVREMTDEEHATYLTYKWAELPKADETPPATDQRDVCICPDRVRNNTAKRAIKNTQQRSNSMRNNYTMRKGI